MTLAQWTRCWPWKSELLIVAQAVKAHVDNMLKVDESYGTNKDVLYPRSELLMDKRKAEV